jgi:hypothetical protein
MSNNATRMRALEERIKEARTEGALFHPTNPIDSWYCKDCGVFGKGQPVCWSCDSTDVQVQWVPRFGGGAQNVIIEPELDV